MNKVSVYESFDRLPPAYTEVFDKAGTSSVFLSLDWFNLLGKAIFAHATPALIYGVESAAGTPRVVLPLWRIDESHKLTSASNYYTPLFSPLIPPPQDDVKENFKLLADAIAQAQPRWNTLNLYPMDPESRAFASMLEAFRCAGMLADSYFCSGNWYLDVRNRSYREYVDALPSRLRNTLQRKRKQASKDGLKLDIILDEDGLEDGIAVYESVYNASWKIPEAYPAFMPGLIRLCAERGWLRLGIARLNGMPVAAQVWIVSHGVASIYKLAYDERYANLSVGSLLTAHLMEHVIDVDRVSEVDFLTGDDNYKQDWMSGRRERRGIVVFNPRTLRGMRAALQHFGGRALRGAWRFLIRSNQDPVRRPDG